jgi:hypothetical protein
MKLVLKIQVPGVHGAAIASVNLARSYSETNCGVNEEAD